MIRIRHSAALASLGLVVACGVATVDGATSEAPVLAVADHARSVVAIRRAGGVTCPGVFLPGGMILTVRACLEVEPCKSIDRASLTVEVPGTAQRTDVLETMPSAATCTEYVALRPRENLGLPPLKIRRGDPVDSGAVLTFVRVGVDLAQDAGPREAGTDAAADARSSDADVADVQVDASPEGDAAVDAEPFAFARINDAGPLAGERSTVARYVMPVRVSRVRVDLRPDGRVRRYEVEPAARTFGVAIDPDGLVVGLADVTGVFAEPTTLPGFDALVGLYANPGEVLAGPTYASPDVPPPAPAPPRPTRPTSASAEEPAPVAEGCRIGAPTRAAPGAPLALALALVVVRRRRRRVSR